jgi:hypothetical protein
MYKCFFSSKIINTCMHVCMHIYICICTHRKHTVCVPVIILHKWHRLYVLFFSLLLSLHHIVERSFHVGFWSVSIFSLDRLPRSCAKGLPTSHCTRSRRGYLFPHTLAILVVFKSDSFFFLLTLVILFPVTWDFWSFSCLPARGYLSEAP